MPIGWMEVSSMDHYCTTSRFLGDVEQMCSSRETTKSAQLNHNQPGGKDVTFESAKNLNIGYSNDNHSPSLCLQNSDNVF